jgi:hypothetical protein
MEDAPRRRYLPYDGRRQRWNAYAGSDVSEARSSDGQGKHVSIGPSEPMLFDDYLRAIQAASLQRGENDGASGLYSFLGEQSEIVPPLSSIARLSRPRLGALP